MNHLRKPMRHGKTSQSRSLLLLLVGVLVAPGSFAAEEEIPLTPEVITNISRIWSFPEEVRAKANPVRLTVTVTYYEPAWGLLWIQESDHGIFCVPRAPFPEIRLGQQIELSAVTRPGTREIVLSNAQ